MHGTERLIRVTHCEREDAVERLRAAYTTGCLNDGELEERTCRAYAAKTRGQLADLVNDLPAAPPSEIAALAPRARAGERARRALGWGCWLWLAAVGAWPIAVAARGPAAVPLIFAWLLLLRLSGLLLFRRRH